MIGDWKRRTVPIASALPPPPNTTAPVSPSNARSRLSSSLPTAQTSGSLWPSVVVAMGEPRPFCFAHQAKVAAGGVVAEIRSAVRSPLQPPAGAPWKAM